ncbi:MAG TPA: cytochrome c [Longimicrobiales bacterium]
MAPRALLLGLGLAACKGVDTGVYWGLERMIVQPRYEPYGESRFFADGRAMRPPPAGTVPAGERAGPGEPTVPGAMDGGGYRERIPLALTMDLLRLGRERFDVVCAACHGILGDGASAVALHMTLRPPPPLIGGNVRAMPAGRLYRIVEEGYGLMPGYAELLSPLERWAVVAYLRALQLSQAADLDALPPAIRAEALERLGAGAGRAR